MYFVIPLFYSIPSDSFLYEHLLLFPHISVQTIYGYDAHQDINLECKGMKYTLVVHSISLQDFGQASYSTANISW